MGKAAKGNAVLTVASRPFLMVNVEIAAQGFMKNKEEDYNA